MKPQTERVANVRLTSPDKILYPAQGVTKRELAEYLARMAQYLLPHVAGRPLSLVRCPEGRTRSCFFQRHLGPGMPPSFHPIHVPGSGAGSESVSGAGKKPYLYIDTVEGLVASAQLGVLELHLWGARIDDLEHPDRLVFDLDPDPAVAFGAVKRAARLLRDILASAGLRSFVMLTGGKGLHVVTPLQGGSDWEKVKSFARGIATAVATSEPDKYIAKASKHQRTGRIFIDWLRNMRGGTAVAPYSTRARAGCPIAVPIGWQELTRIARADQYNIRTIERRLRSLARDPWAEFFRTRQDIPEDALGLFR